jgi:hypothetical protein
MCRGLILFSGYASIGDAAIGYPNIPLLLPFHGIGFLENFMKGMIRDKFESHKKLGSISCPILLIHGTKDRDINYWQSKVNFLEAFGGRMDCEIVNHKKGYWDVRKNRFKPSSVDGLVQTKLPGEEGELWSCVKGNPLWLLLVQHAGHNDLSIHEVVRDTIEGWLKEKPKTA